MVFNSFHELAAFMGVDEKQAIAKSRRCRKCGAVMRHIDGTNVDLCPGKKEDGSPCGNRAFRTTLQ